MLKTLLALLLLIPSLSWGEQKVKKINKKEFIASIEERIRLEGGFDETKQFADKARKLREHELTRQILLQEYKELKEKLDDEWLISTEKEKLKTLIAIKVQEIGIIFCYSEDGYRCLENIKNNARADISFSNTINNKPKDLDLSTLFQNNNSRSSSLNYGTDSNPPAINYVPSSTFNNLPILGDSFSTKKPFTEPFKEGTGLNYNEQFWFD